MELTRERTNVEAKTGPNTTSQRRRVGNVRRRNVMTLQAGGWSFCDQRDQKLPALAVGACGQRKAEECRKRQH